MGDIAAPRAERALEGRFWQLLAERPQDRAGKPPVVALANQKGGVGKTATSVNVSAALATRGHDVLVVDLDPQANTTTGVGLDRRAARPSTYDALFGDATVDEVVRHTRIDGLKCAPSSLDLAGAEIELTGLMARERKLAEALDKLSTNYDIVFIDCPPSLGLLTVNALTAAHDVIVPVQCEYYALEGLEQLLDTAERVRRSLNPALRVGGIVLTMYDGRTKLSSEVVREVRSHFGRLVYDSIVPRSVRISEAPSYGEPVLTLDPSSSGAIAYQRLAVEIATRYGLGYRASRVDATDGSEDDARNDSRDDALNDSWDIAAPGPAGRGYGTVAPEPPDLDRAWPRPEPWSAGA